MNDLPEDIEDNDDVEIEDEFNPDELDLNELESEVTLEEAESLTGQVPPFLARLQWWGFGLLLAFILLVIVRMIFGPPWIDRFLTPRWPVAMDANDKWIGVVVPLIEEKTDNFIYKLFFIDRKGSIVYQENLGRVQSQMGSLDIALGNDYCYYITGSGTWVGVRPYENPEDSNLDIDLRQFNFRYRDGLNLIRIEKQSRELIEIFNDSNLVILERDGPVWKSVLERGTISWEAGMDIVDIDKSYALVSSGPALYVTLLDNFRMPQNRYFIKSLQKRPLYPGEFVYRPAFVKTFQNEKGFLVVKNDRMFNFPYKLSDDQCFIKGEDSDKIKALRHPYFVGHDIRNAVILVSEMPEDEKEIKVAILYEAKKEFHLAVLRLDESKPLWDISLGQSASD